MHRRLFLRKSLGAFGAAFAAPPFYRCSKDSDRPNFILILIDDLGWKDVGFMGSDYYETPNIDRLAGEGVIFTQAYANAPNCAPTRASLLSGQYSPRHGVYTVNSSERGEPRFRKIIPVANKTTLSPQITTFAETLAANGYACASIGKWHLGKAPHHGPLTQGFDLNVGGNLAGHPESYFSPYKNPDLSDGPDGEYLTDRLTDEAIAFIKKNRKKPFFLYLPHFAVHTPIQAKENLVKKYQHKTPGNGQNNPRYAAMVESVDQNVGRILAALDSNGLDQNTVVIFYSDNGGHGALTSMAPLRGSKGMLYEGGIRVPLAIRWPKRISAGSVCSEPVISIDFFPTFIDIANIKRPADQPLDGKSLLPLLTGEKQTLDRKAIYWHFPAYLQSYAGDSPWRTTPVGAIRYGDWKLLEFFEDNRIELYNLQEDIGESNNLANSCPEKAKTLHQELVAWRQKLNAPVPGKPNPLYDPQAKD